MNRYYGFDLGDAESAVSRLDADSEKRPQVLTVCGEKSLITAYADLMSGEIVIGEKACYAANAVKRRIRFKSRFLTDKDAEGDVRCFAAGVLSELYAAGELQRDEEDCCFYIGCPAGWKSAARERYRALFERCGYPPLKIISESRAALVSVCQSRHMQVGYDILSRPVLIVDVGSSTTDFAYICGGHEVEIQTAGEVALGGGIMDSLLLEMAAEQSKQADRIHKIFAESEPWKNYCEFAARRLKEKYFTDADYWKDHACVDSVLIQYDRPVRLTLRMDEEAAHRLQYGKTERLGNRSFCEVFTQSLKNVRDHINGDMPEIICLTGGVSKMPDIREWCMEVFPDAVAVSDADPEFSVSRGLAWCGRIDDELHSFKAELRDFVQSDRVESIVKSHIDELYHKIVDTMVDPILQNAAVPVFERWRSGEIARLRDVDKALQSEIESYLRTDEAHSLMMKPVAQWLMPVAGELEEYTVPICVKHHVPYRALSLQSYLTASDINIKIDAKNIFAVDEITLLIDSIISLLIGLLCGGSGVALISSGPTGILAGAVISLLVLLLGKNKMEDVLLDADIPKPLRKMVTKHSLQSRLGSVGADVRRSLYESLENDFNEEISARMIDDISSQIETCLTRMAEVVEIPLG